MAVSNPVDVAEAATPAQAVTPILRVSTLELFFDLVFVMSPRHFVERHGLVTLIALGESVVVIGTGAADRALTPSLLAAVVLGLALVASLWWAYFGQDDARAVAGSQVQLTAIVPALVAMLVVERRTPATDDGLVPHE